MWRLHLILTNTSTSSFRKRTFGRDSDGLGDYEHMNNLVCVVRAQDMKDGILSADAHTQQAQTGTYIRDLTEGAYGDTLVMSISTPKTSTEIKIRDLITRNYNSMVR